MYEIWLDVTKDAGVVSDEHYSEVLILFHAIYALRDDAKCINIEARICLVENGNYRFQKFHLQDLMALLLAAREAFINISL